MKMSVAQGKFTRRLLPLALFAVSIPSPAAALPETQGAIKYQVLTRTKTLAGKVVGFNLYIPQVKTPMPVVVLGHGFARSRVQMSGWGKLLASRGYVAAAPNFPGPLPDHNVNGKIMSALQSWIVADSKITGSPLLGRVDGTRRGVMGHSAGGLASVLAAAGDSTSA